MTTKYINNTYNNLPILTICSYYNHKDYNINKYII